MNLKGFSKKYANTVYLDSAATSLTPLDVVKAGSQYYTDYNANPHRGMYHISERASYEWEGSRCCLLYTSPSPRDATLSRMPSSA